MIFRVPCWSIVGLLAATGCVEPNPNLAGTDGNATSGPSSGGTLGTTDTSGSEGGPSTTPSTSSADATGDVDTTTSAGCPASSHACVAEAPDGWNGPNAVIHSTGSDAPECEAPFDGEATRAFAGLDAAPAVCDCECDVIDPVCGAFPLISDDVPACEGGNDSGQVSPALACSGVPDNATGYVAALAPEVSSGACSPNPTTMVPPGVFATGRTICPSVLEDLDGCGAEEVCAAVPTDPFDAGLCVWTLGDVPCPEGIGYDVRELLYRDIDDTRGCTACVCGEIGGTCTGTVTLWSASGCSGSQLADLPVDGACQAVAGVAVSASVVYDEAATCGSPTGAQPTGQAEPTDALTLCCRA